MIKPLQTRYWKDIRWSFNEFLEGKGGDFAQAFAKAIRLADEATLVAMRTIRPHILEAFDRDSWDEKGEQP